MITEITIRKTKFEDLPSLQDLCVKTIKHSCKFDYSSKQILAWTSSLEDIVRWRHKISTQYFLLAETENNVVGFASLDGSNHIDLLYVHQDHLRKGIASKLFLNLESTAIRLGATSLTSDVSITARPFFERHGFRTQKKNSLMISDELISNFRMKKSIATASDTLV